MFSLAQVPSLFWSPLHHSVCFWEDDHVQQFCWCSLLDRVTLICLPPEHRHQIGKQSGETAKRVLSKRRELTTDKLFQQDGGERAHRSFTRRPHLSPTWELRSGERRGLRSGSCHGPRGTEEGAEIGGRWTHIHSPVLPFTKIRDLEHLTSASGSPWVRWSC